jgi:hypothetical protein
MVLTCLKASLLEGGGTALAVTVGVLPQSANADSSLSEGAKPLSQQRQIQSLHN